MTANYVQEVPMTREEKIDWYVKHNTKKQLAEMLYNANEILKLVCKPAYVNTED